MEHVGTICTHCSNGCKTTLGVRNDEIIRGNNRDRSGINGEFLCIKGRYAFDFYEHPERLQSPLMRMNGQAGAGVLVAGADSGRAEVRRGARRAAASSASSARTTPPTKRISTCRSSRAQGLGTNNIDHHRTGDVVTLLDALSGQDGRARDRRPICTTRRRCWSSAPTWRSSIRSSPSRSAPTSGITRRTSTRSPNGPVREDKLRGGEPCAPSRARNWHGVESLREQLDSRAGTGHRLRRRDQGRRCAQAGRVRRFARDSGEVRLPGDYSNSRGAIDMGARSRYRAAPDAA